ncbi:MAG: sulfatase-like hydrolase/transferase, partial [Anaerolineaceae bacterium]|nr:sulfatase-like hydrolase/transferase [Anaerolineaceae bacterium]
MTQTNILFILMDDMGWRDIAPYGSTFYETPNLDRLRREGMLFTDAYAACPVCSPTRASILSGQYPARVGLTNYIGGDEHPAHGKLIDTPYIRYLPHNITSVAETLRRSGYHTWHVGKWHLGTEEYYPKTHGFEENVGGCHYGCPPHGYFSPYRIDNLPDGPDGEFLTDRLTDEAIRLINEKQDDRPFYLNLNYYAVHHPIQAKAKHIDDFRQKAKRLGLDKENPFEVGECFPTHEQSGKRIVRRVVQSDPIYAAMIYSLDENIGRLLDTLDQTGMADDTLVIFTSDNGGLSTSEG